MKKTLIIVISLLAAVIGGAIGKGLVRSYFDGRKASKVEEALAAAERQVNAMGPKMVDDTTRLDGAKAGPGKKFTYTYTLVSLKAADVDSGAWKQKVVPTIRKNMRDAQGMRYLFQVGTTVHYRYLGSDGAVIDEIVMTPAEALAR
ncbi:MAG: hypothetical protein RIQ93_326 [Verrucomicrobiota bacterium]|jgi:hypothetical protein